MTQLMCRFASELATVVPMRRSIAASLVGHARFLPSLRIRSAYHRPYHAVLQPNSQRSVFAASPFGLPHSRPVHASLLACLAKFSASDVAADLGVMIEGEPNANSSALDALAEALYVDGQAVVKHAAMIAVEGEERDAPPGPLELSLVLCDDAHIQELNREWRGKDAPTDVLSFEMLDEGEEASHVLSEAEIRDLFGDEAEKEHDDESEVSEEDDRFDVNSRETPSPATLLGDVVISVDTAMRQAKERGHSLHDECRILLVHGVLHLLGYDHEQGDEEAEEMASAEKRILRELGWKGEGLVSDGSMHESSDQDQAPPTTPRRLSPARFTTKPDIRLLALDMDGTLLDSASNVLPSSVQAIQAALRRGVRVMLATGKARPAAMAALAPLGLAGDGLVVGPSHPGIFLQGLAVHDFSGALIAGGALTSDVVRQAFEYAEKHDIAAVGFTGEECVTLNMKPEVKELHERYYEPLAEVAPCLRELLEGPPLRKLLFMAPREVVETRLKAHWNVALENTTAQPMQAVPTMLEVVPRGWNKWVGMQALLAHESVDAASVMAIGDGGNDLELVANAGIGVAMANGVEQVKSVAHAVVASNDEGGVAEAIERFIL